MRLTRQNAAAITILIVIITGGAYLRFSHLTAYNLIQEELNHYYVGQNIAHGQPPALPSGQWYSRGIEYSWLVSLTQGRIERAEIAVRLPAALLGTLCLVVMAIGTWFMAGPWAAVGATLLLALYPEAVTQSRTGRFYPLQLLAFLLAFFAGWRALKGRFTDGRLTTWSLLLLTTALLLGAAHIQVTALVSVLAWLTVIGVTGFLDGSSGKRRWSESVLVHFAGAVFLLFLVLVVLDPFLIDRAIVRAISLPYWARVHGGSWTFYLRHILDDFNTVAILAPACFLYLLWRRFSLGVYLFAFFAVPAFVLSFLLPFKAERFLLLGTPALFIASAVAWADASRALLNYLRRRLELRRVTRMQRDLVAVGLVAVIALGGVLAMRAPRRAPRQHWNRVEPNWKMAGNILRSRTDLRAVPFGGSKSLPPRFYWGRLDFNIGRNFLEQWGFSPLGEAGVSSGRVGSYVTLPIGAKDLYGGVPVLTTPDAIRKQFVTAGSVVIGIDGQANFYRMIDSTLVQVLQREGEEICRNRCGSLQVYVWRFR